MPNLNEEQIVSIAALGFNLYQQGQLGEAQTIFEGLTAIDPTNYTGYAGLGAVALAKDPPALDEAVSHLTMAAGINDSDPTVHANLGEALLRQGKFEEATQAFEKALALDPNEEDPGANRARAIIDGMELVVAEIERMGSAA
ncbi:MAG: tetratricopeptide repeat protein [Acidobacteria bacterium]|nr:tetratricopeptide repeat protein [Acidobacteriota bacterium]MBI3410701.1 tetratricopeptide repeat protein [Planctomycetota bacterium]